MIQEQPVRYFEDLPPVPFTAEAAVHCAHCDLGRWQHATRPSGRCRVPGTPDLLDTSFAPAWGGCATCGWRVTSAEADDLPAAMRQHHRSQHGVTDPI